MDEEVLKNLRKKKSTLTPSEALYKKTIQTLRCLDLGTQIYQPNLFKSFALLDKDKELKEDIPKTNPRSKPRYTFFETDVGLGKPTALKNSQIYEGKPPLEIGTSRKLTVNPSVMAKLDLSLIKPITPLGVDDIFIPSPYRVIKKKNKKKRKKKAESPIDEAPEIVDVEEPTPSTSQDKKVLCADLFRTLKEHIIAENQSNAELNFVTNDIDEPLVVRSNNSSNEVTSQTENRTSATHVDVEQSILKSETESSIVINNEQLKPETRSSLIITELLKAEEGQPSTVRPKTSLLKTPSEEYKISIKDSKTTDDKDLLDKAQKSIPLDEKSNNKKQKDNKTKENVPSIQATNERKQSKSKKKKEKALDSAISKTKQKISDPKPQDSAISKTKQKISEPKPQDPAISKTKQKISEPKPQDSAISKTKQKISEPKPQDSAISKTKQKISEPKPQDSAISKTKQKINEPKPQDSAISKTKQKISEPKPQDPVKEVVKFPTTPEKSTRPSHPRKQVTPQKIKNPGLKLLTAISESCKPDSISSSEIFNQPVWDRTARPRFNIQLEHLFSESQRSEAEVSDTKTKVQPPEETPDQVLVKIQSAGTKLTRPSINVEMQSVSADPQVPDPIESEPNKKVGFKIPKNLLKELTPISVEVETLDPTQKLPPRPSYSTEPNPEQENTTYNLMYEEITPPEILKALKDKEAQLPSPEKDDKGQPILRLRLHQNLPEPRPRVNVPATKPLRSAPMSSSGAQPERHETGFKLPIKNLSYIVDSFASPEEFTPRERLQKLLPPLQSFPTKIRKMSSPAETNASSATGSNGNGKGESSSRNTSKKDKDIKKQSNPQMEPVITFPNYIYPEPKEQRVISKRYSRNRPKPIKNQKQQTELETETNKSETTLTALQLKKSESDLIEMPKLESLPSQPNETALLESKNETKSSVTGSSQSPTQGSSGICEEVSNKTDSNEIRKLSTSMQDLTSISTSTPLPLEIYTPASPTPGTSGIHKPIASTLERSGMHKSAEPLESSDISSSGSSSSSPGYRFSRYKKRNVHFKRSSFTESDSSGSAYSPPSKQYDVPKSVLPRIRKQVIQLKNKSYSRARSSGSQRSLLPSDSGDTRKKEYIPTRPSSQNKTQKSQNVQTEPQSALQIPTEDTYQLVTSQQDPKENNNSLSLASPSYLLNAARKFENYPPDTSQNLKSLPFPPPEPAGFRNISRKTRYMENRDPLYDERGIHIESGKDLCDCLVSECKGCFTPCTKCNSTKCGLDCRVNRQFVLDDAVFDDTQ